MDDSDFNATDSRDDISDGTSTENEESEGEASGISDSSLPSYVKGNQKTIVQSKDHTDDEIEEDSDDDTYEKQNKTRKSLRPSTSIIEDSDFETSLPSSNRQSTSASIEMNNKSNKSRNSSEMHNVSDIIAPHTRKKVILDSDSDSEDIINEKSMELYENLDNITDKLNNSHLSENADGRRRSNNVFESSENLRRSMRVSEFDIKNLLSSTTITDTSISTPIKLSSLKTEMLTPRVVQQAISSRSPSPDIVEILSDSEDELTSTNSNATMRQPTLKEIINKPNLKVRNDLFPSKKMSHEVTQREYQQQKDKVHHVQFEMHKAQNLLRTIKLDSLPDKGVLLMKRQESLQKSCDAEEEKLKKMVVVESAQDVPPIATGPKPASWSDLNAVSKEVQPRTFGRQAMATHNLQKALTMDRLQQLHGSLKNCPMDDVMADDPKGVKVDLMPHQKHALAWLMWREQQKPSGGILADDMGLGKTLTMISLMLKMREEQGDNDESDEENSDNKSERYKYYGGTLVVCPASLLGQWSGEIERRLKRGLISVDLYHGTKRETRAKTLAKYDVVITTYAIVKNEKDKSSPLFTIKWNRVILDEAHQVRNHKSQASVAVCHLAAKSRWALTGTPIHNKEVDIYSLLKFLRCSPFDDLAVFKRWASDKNTGGQERLNTVMSSLMLRRTKAQLQTHGFLKCLPERNWDLIEIHLTKPEMDVYQKILIFSRTLFSQYLHQRAEKQDGASMSTNFGKSEPSGEYLKMHQKIMKMNKVKIVKQHEILVLLLRLRQICCHPSLILGMLEKGEIECGTEDTDEDAINILEQLDKLNLDDNTDAYTGAPEGLSNESVGLAEASRGILNPSQPIFQSERRSSKLDSAIKLIKERVLSENDKAIVVSQWTGLLNILAEYLVDEEINFDRLDGSIPVHKRADIVDNFNDPNSKTSILLLSLTAGGVGLNLVGANHLLLLDLHWNPQLEMQAQDRIYRVGQKKSVYVYKFMALDTIEERIKALQDRKKAIAEAMLTGAKIQQSKLSIDDLKMLFSV